MRDDARDKQSTEKLLEEAKLALENSKLLQQDVSKFASRARISSILHYLTVFVSLVTLAYLTIVQFTGSYSDMFGLVLLSLAIPFTLFGIFKYSWSRIITSLFSWRPFTRFIDQYLPIIFQTSSTTSFVDKVSAHAAHSKALIASRLLIASLACFVLPLELDLFAVVLLGLSAFVFADVMFIAWRRWSGEYGNNALEVGEAAIYVIDRAKTGGGGSDSFDRVFNEQRPFGTADSAVGMGEPAR